MPTHIFVPAILLMIGKASSYYNQSYDGYTIFLPDAIMDHSSSKPLELSFYKAQHWCTENVAGSTLATIPNKVVQQDISNFLESALQKKQLLRSRDSNIRLNGQYNYTDSWHWVNGHQNAGMHGFLLLNMEIIVNHRKQ